MIEQYLRVLPSEHDNVSEIHAEIKKQQEYKLVGKLILRKGMRLYAATIETGEIEEINIHREVMVGFDGKPITKSRVNYDSRKYYFTAINRKNAIRKWNKLVQYVSYASICKV